MWRLLHNLGKAVVLLWLAVAALHAGFFDQLWPEADVYIKASENTRLYFYASGTRSEEAGRTDAQIGGAIDFFLAPLLEDREYRRPDQARNRMLMLRVGYFYDTTPKEIKNAYHANTPFVELTPRYYLPWKVLVTNRNRGDFRFQNGVFFPRYRNRLKLERTLEMGKRAITLYVSAEAWYDVRYNCFYRLRYETGTDFELFKWFVLETFYTRQQDSHPKFKHLNALGLTALFHLR
jgi:hypothetical protein